MNFASAVPSSVVPSPASAASATTASGHAIDPARLDPVAIGKLRALTRPGKPNILVKLSKMFFSSMAKEAKTMADSLDSGDAPTLCRAAHTLKSSSAQFGANELSRHCRELEERAAAGDLSDAADRIANLNGEYAKVRIALERIVEQEEATSA